ncbi:MAG: hypothetical protein U5L04_11115 [Trueperaceae bacterium]|nr:hypothetical protein [Trueperaceae bacterium]
MRRVWLLLALTCTALSSCTFTYTPPVPRSYELAPTLRLSGASDLTRQPEGLRLRLIVVEVPEADWLAVQWFDPRNDEVASESVWLEPDTTATSYDLFLPDTITVVPGQWRAVVSYQGRIVRQLSFP